MWVQACKGRHNIASQLMHQSKWCYCPLHHCSNLCTIQHISGMMSFYWWLPVVLRTDVTELCTSGPVTSPVTAPTHSWEVPSPSSWMPSPSWHCTVFTTVPLLLVLISAYWVTYLFPCCLPPPTEHEPPSACILLGLFLAVSPASWAALAQQNRVQWGSAEWTCCWNLLLTGYPKQKTLHF